MNRSGFAGQAATAVLLLSLGLTLPARAQVNVNITIAPPAARYEPIPLLRPGQVWAPGYWAWNGARYDWIQGHQIAQRPGHRWVADHWESGNRYRAGYWAPERGYDGQRDRHRYGEREREHDRDREREGEREGKHHRDKDRGHGHGEEFCPPGQAKKGNC